MGMNSIGPAILIGAPLVIAALLILIPYVSCRLQRRRQRRALPAPPQHFNSRCQQCSCPRPPDDEDAQPCWIIDEQCPVHGVVGNPELAAAAERRLERNRRSVNPYGSPPAKDRVAELAEDVSQLKSKVAQLEQAQREDRAAMNRAYFD